MHSRWFKGNIKRREMPCLLSLFLLLLSVVGWSQSSRPNIIFIQAEREATVHQSCRDAFAIRKGKLAPGSGGWSIPSKPEDLQGLPPVQLYDLEADPAETINLQDKYPAVVQELKALLRQYQASGRSATGR